MVTKKMKIKEIIAHLLILFFSIFPIRKNKIVFKSYFGNRMDDNPLILYQWFLKNRPTYTFVWLLHNNVDVPKGTIVCKPESIKGLYHQATAKLWIDNARKGTWLSKRKGQYYLQTWHGNIAFKKIEADVSSLLPDRYVRNAKHDSEMMDWLLSGSKYGTDQFKKCFWFDGSILEFGLPRADIFYSDYSPIVEEVYSHYGIPKSVKLVLYAPTFRNDNNTDCYNIDFDNLIKALKERFGGEWKVLFRLHPNIANKVKPVGIDDHILNGSEIEQMNKLIIASTIVITDYSSSMFDALECGKKVLLYASDIESYDKERGSYFQFSELPFPLAKNNEELTDVVKNFDESHYQVECEAFIERLGFCNQPDSAGKICDYLAKEISI